MVEQAPLKRLVAGSSPVGTSTVMKYIMLFCFLLFSPLAQADFLTGLLVGTSMSNPSKTVVVNRDEFSLQVEQIKNYLPEVREPFYSNQAEFLIEGKDKNKYLNYFSNGGYTVSYQEGKLIFNLQNNYSLYIQREQKIKESQKKAEANWQAIKPYLKTIGIIFLVILVISSFFRAVLEMNRLGFTQFFLKVLTNQIEKIKQNK
jgi:hypothetical protein